MAKSKAPTNIKAEQQARQLNYVHDSLNKEVVSQLIVDQYYNKLKDIGDGFRGTVLGFKEVSIIGDPDALREGKRFSSYVYTENGKGTHQNALEGNYFVIYVRPEWFDAVPPPHTFDLVYYQTAMQMHPVAVSNQNLGFDDGEIEVKVGDIVRVSVGAGVSPLENLVFDPRPVDFDSLYVLKFSTSVLKSAVRRSTAFINTDEENEPDKNPKGQWQDKTKVDINYSMNPIFSHTGAHSDKTKMDAHEQMEITLGLYKQLKEKLDFPIKVNDAIPKKGSSRETGNPSSRHFHGQALDISIRGLTRKQAHELVRAASEVGFMSLGFSSTYLHVQWEPKERINQNSNKPPYSWNYGNKYFAGVAWRKLYKWTKAGGFYGTNNPYPKVSNPKKIAAPK